MNSKDFRRWGHALIDWIADYQDRVGDLPVSKDWIPGQFRGALPPHPPESGEGFDAIYADIDRLIVPHILHWQSPNFFAYFPANTSGPAILGELLSAGLGVQGMLWATSPACTELETHMLDWLVELCHLPPAFLSTGPGGGVLLDSASSATLVALIAAREKALKGAGNRTGLKQAEQALTVYVSESTHSSAIKAARIAGIGDAHIRLLPTDEADRMVPERLREAIAEDRRSGKRPFFCVGTIGSTGINAIDPIESIGAVCQAEGLWFHIDAAMSGSAGLCPEKADLFQGVAWAQSYTFNPHKWLLTTPDCNAFFVTDRQALTNALSITPSYLQNGASASGEVIDYRDWQIPLGRRFRALKLWFVLRYFGRQGLSQFIRQHLIMAQWLKEEIDQCPELNRVGEVPLALVCFQCKGSEAKTLALLKALNATGQLFLSHTVFRGKTVIRFSIGAAQTRPDHVRQAWRLIQSTLKTLDRHENL